MATHVLTGFPGFIGKRLARALLERSPDQRLIALVEPRMQDLAREEATAIDGRRIEIVAGDIGEPRLGLEADAYRRLVAEASVVHHLAAIYDLAVPLEIARRVNVTGTANVLALCRDCDRLERLNYVSTAYVAGDRTGVVHEHELAAGQGFKNHYESTKYEAEVAVREALAEIPTTIFRPGIVVGDSRTGETQKFDGPYYVLRFIRSMARRHLPLVNIGRGEAPFNVVPVDFIVAALVELGVAPEAVGETVHLCDPDPLPARKMFELLADLYVGRPPRLRLPPRPTRAALRLRALRSFFGGVPPQSITYLNHPVRYDTSRAEELLGARGLRCPPFAEYAPTMVEFYRAHEDDPAMLGEAR